MSLENSSCESMKVDTAVEVHHLEILPVDSPVLGNLTYYEKNGLRIEGDGLDHNHYNPYSTKFIMTIIGCCCTMAGAIAAPMLYLSLGTLIATDLKAGSLTPWLFTGMIIAMGSIAPFVGPLADLAGRRILLLAGIVVSTLGGVICAATPTAEGFIAGQILIGCGSVMQELLAMSIVSEIVPTAKRSLFAALMLCTLIPWSPGTLYANWIAEANWRWIGLVVTGLNAMTFGIIAIFYHPPPRTNSVGLSRKEMIGRIDFVGGFILTLGLVFFLIALNWGGQQYPWQSARVLSFLIIGILLTVGFGFWEFFGARYPLFPRRIIHAPRPFFCLLTVIFMASINFVPVVVFWPIESISVFGSNHFQTGINTLPIGLSIMGGALVSAILIGTFRRHITLIMTIFCILQTVASACLTIINPQDIRTAWGPLVISLIGVGGVLVPNQIVITMITPDDLIASITALTIALRAHAQVMGLAVFYNRFVNEVTVNASKYVFPAMLEIGVSNMTDITTLVSSLTGVSLSQYAGLIPELQNPAHYEIVKEATVKCFSESILSVYYIMIAFGVLACFAAACMGDVSQYIDDHVAVPI